MCLAILLLSCGFLLIAFGVCRPFRTPSSFCLVWRLLWGLRAVSGVRIFYVLNPRGILCCPTSNRQFPWGDPTPTLQAPRYSSNYSSSTGPAPASNAPSHPNSHAVSCSTHSPSPPTKSSSSPSPPTPPPLPASSPTAPPQSHFAVFPSSPTLSPFQWLTLFL